MMMMMLLMLAPAVCVPIELHSSARMAHVDLNGTAHAGGHHPGATCQEGEGTRRLENSQAGRLHSYFHSGI